MLLIYGVTWLAWGAVAQSQINAYSISLSLAVVLSLGTSLVTLLALAPQAIAKTKIQLSTQLGMLKALNAFKHSIETDCRYVLLAVFDLLKLILALAMLARTEHISL